MEAAEFKPDDRTLLLDLENLGCVRPQPLPLRARLTELLGAAGPVHHAVAAYVVRTRLVRSSRTSRAFSTRTSTSSRA